MVRVTLRASFVERLPNELLILIFDQLQARDVARASQVSIRWNACASDERQWRAHYSAYTERPLETLRLSAPAPATWRQFYNTTANLRRQEARASTLENQVQEAERRARAWPNWRLHGRMARRHFTQGIGNAFYGVLSPIVLGGAAASSALGLALGVGGVTTGLTLGLAGLATAPIIGGTGIAAGALIAIEGVRSSMSLQEFAINCLFNGVLMLTSSAALLVSNELQALGQAIATVAGAGELGYHTTIRAPRARIQAAKYSEQRNKILARLPQLRAHMQQNEAILGPPAAS